MKKLYGIFCILMIGMTGLAQDIKEATPVMPFKSHWMLQVNGGITQYYGDLNVEDWYNPDPKTGFGGILGYQFSPVFGVRSQFVAGKLYSKHEARDLELKTDF